MVEISIKRSIDDLDIFEGLFVVGLDENNKDLNYLSKNTKLMDILNRHKVIQEEHLENIRKFGKNMILSLNDGDKLLKILLLGIGDGKKLNEDKLRQLGGIISLRAKELNFPNVIISNFYSSSSQIESIIEGLVLSLYEFNKFKEDKADKTLSTFYVNYSVVIVTTDDSNDGNKIDIGKIVNICEAVFYARDLANSPPNVIDPNALANSAKTLEKMKNIHVDILNQNQIKDLGMNGIISVGKGSENEPKLIIVEYNNSTSTDKPIVLVGKAVTFDTGGISIKPSDRMDEMKFDKSGGCTVLGIMKALGNLDLPINVVAIIPAVENMPSGSSYRPGDIIRMYNGKTVEVLNTDAEGRLILADALAYGVAKYAPKCILDFATLTGACIIALGTNIAGIIGNDNKLINKLVSISNITGEKIWQLPLSEEFSDLIKSNVATIKNIGGRTGGTITAAAFLSYFVSDVPWAHFDIAGTAWTQDGTADKSYNPKGSTGFGIRTIIKFLEQYQYK
ncbi:leucyl aminopeptidase [Candidatus Nitrosocosmicus arcticus]|uniref:Probable cytosol aminopeptidase n=1 Tax=Candidatus Nitrosocosmicus arcticus TaxID=2035267 RepID=A0A557SSL3_9ARCH|nr:leucyl aminopeptidase [Candidatus Nitrosocosmicus arcticus]TVP39582.1 leucyl aminopeptidase [Candidatus Nitrosocosmicus arcticus]